MPTVGRFQVVLKHVSGLPRDNVTNTFWVEDLAGDFEAGELEAVCEKIRDFYTVTAPTATKGLMSHLNRCIKTEGHEVKATQIDVATGEDERGVGFPPEHVEVFDLIGRAVDLLAMPNEVALCLSFKNMASGAIPPARRRGRIYFGPVGGGSAALSGDVTVPSANLMADLLKAGNKLHDDLDAIGKRWVVYSRPFEGRAETPRPGNPRGPLPALAARAGATHDVTDLWVDNAFDTVRKRGEKATARSTQVA